MTNSFGTSQNIRIVYKGENMIYFIFILLCAVTGFVLADAGIFINNWHFWVIAICTVSAYMCGILMR